ncbi:MAG TPA: alanine racemase [Candidatus Tectomicrobia bacterium]|nr:alanine racemase [Candidatus Tectomicrobia bacterium]
MERERWPGRPCWAEVDLDAITNNVKLLGERASPARLCAVVKANAYGHGAVAVGRAAIEAGAASLGVVCVDEGEQLRGAGIDAPVLVLGATEATEAERIVGLRLTPTVCSMQLALALSRFASERGVSQPVHLELESGLNRNGLPADELVAFAERVRRLPGIEVEGIFTHFAAAEEGDQTFTRAQYERLLAVCERLPWIPLRHCSATASALADHDLALDMVRAGIGVYGYEPAPGIANGLPLRRALSLKSRVARVLEVKAGETVGYGRTWEAARRSRIALVMCGYADGLRRALSNRAELLVRGRRAPVAGRIAMDMCMLDVTDVPGCAAGDEVVIIGEQGGERVDADELAALADTISWEILAGISARVPRLYYRQGELVAVSTLNEPLPRPAAEGSPAT